MLVQNVAGLDVNDYDADDYVGVDGDDAVVAVVVAAGAVVDVVGADANADD